MKTSDIKHHLLAGLMLIGITMGLFSTSIHANPVATILGLLFAEKVSGDVKPATNEGDNTPISTWRKNLSGTELTALNSIQNHPAINTCMKMADQNHPIAIYNARKIAEFSAYVKLSLANTGQTPSIEPMHYQWPARAFRWCSERAGITTAGVPRNLEQLAHGMMRVVQSIDAQQTVVVMKSNIGQAVK